MGVQLVRKLQEVSMVDQYDSFEPVLLADHQGDPRIIDTIFNVSSLTSGIFNNSLFQYAGAIIVGIILFEIALYALDVYYNQTYLNQQTFNQRYDQFYYQQQDPNSFVQDFPAYLDPYHTTYGSLNSGWSLN